MWRITWILELEPFVLFIFWIIRAFDTLAKVLHPTDGSAGESLEATMQLMSGDQSGPVVELEGSLLSDGHFPFKVKVWPRAWEWNAIEATPLMLYRVIHLVWWTLQSCFPPFVLTAYDAFACARVPQCQLYLWVSFPATVSLYALGALYPCLSNTWVSLCYNVVSQIEIFDSVITCQS